MSRHALEVLEFGRVLEHIAARTGGAPARRRILALTPSSDVGVLRRELGRVGATMRFVQEKPQWGMPTVPDGSGALRNLAADGAVLEPVQLYAVGVLLASSRALAGELDSRPEAYEELATIRSRLVDERATQEAIEKAVDAEGQVLDTASHQLKRIRDRLRGAHARLVKKLESYIRTLPDRLVVSDASVSIRDGRYVIPVRREGKGEVGGIVHDESNTGATIFVEPPIATELMNQLRDLERDEAREIRRVLGELTARLHPLHAALVGTLDALIDFDTLHARARCALEWRASVPDIVAPGTDEFRLVQARHPLLLGSLAHPVVPYDLEVQAGERALVVSGPNTGGKSVFLKATGLIAAMAQSGIVPPVGPGTVLPVFESFFADIGDEQSIAQSLSTFSAHLANLGELVERADAHSLVLIDEMGTGTDPAEGAALSRAVLEVLVERGAFTVVSSHLGQLKRLDGEGTGIVNASLQFDPDRMEPTYQLMKGLPGRSYGLAIARRLGFPGGVLDRAEGYREGDEVRMEEVLARLEHREREAEERLQELGRAQREADRRRADVEKREEAVREAERSAGERSRQDARQVLLDARTEVEEAIAEVRAAAHEQSELDEAVTRARRRVEEAAQERGREARAHRKVVRRTGPVPDLSEGARVRVQATGTKGTVVQLRDDRALVEIGALHMEIPLVDLEAVEGGGTADAPRRSGGGTWSGPTSGQVQTEVDLRGLRVDESDRELVRALDGAVLEDLAELRVIHGKGTGVLRRRVGELLEADARVMGFRMGSPQEGGAGVTVVSFR